VAPQNVVRLDETAGTACLSVTIALSIISPRSERSVRPKQLFACGAPPAAETSELTEDRRQESLREMLGARLLVPANQYNFTSLLACGVAPVGASRP
jgi:hypothetical protein